MIELNPLTKLKVSAFSDTSKLMSPTSPPSETYLSGKPKITSLVPEPIAYANNLLPLKEVPEYTAGLPKLILSASKTSNSGG